MRGLRLLICNRLDDLLKDWVLFCKEFVHRDFHLIEALSLDEQLWKLNMLLINLRNAFHKRWCLSLEAFLFIIRFKQ